MRGSVGDRPFGKTIGILARRGASGQLTIQSDGRTYVLVFQRGYLVAARSPVAADRAVAVALADKLLTPAQANMVDRWIDTDPGCDEIDICASIAGLSEAEARRMRRRTIARAGARAIALEHGEVELSSNITIPVIPDCEMHIGGVIHLAARTLVDRDALEAIVDKLGGRFEMHPAAQAELLYYGFGVQERPVLQALAYGLTRGEINAFKDRRQALAMIYALASCGALYCEPQPARFPRGTENLSETPAVIFERGMRALRAERLDEALVDFERVHELVPNDPIFLATLAWARFCAAVDKSHVVAETRRMLSRAIARSDAPVIPRYYLGLVERIMKRPEHALEQFREVLELDPRHAGAATEIRFLSSVPAR